MPDIFESLNEEVKRRIAEEWIKEWKKEERKKLEEFEKNPDSYSSNERMILNLIIIEDTISNANLKLDAKIERLKKFVKDIDKYKFSCILRDNGNRELIEEVLKDAKLSNYINNDVLSDLEEEEQRQILEEFEKNLDSYPLNARKILGSTIIKDTISNANLKLDAKIERLKKFKKNLFECNFYFFLREYGNKELIEKVLKDAELCGGISFFVRPNEGISISVLSNLEEEEQKQILEEFEKNPDSYPSITARVLSNIIINQSIINAKRNANLETEAKMERTKKFVKYLSNYDIDIFLKADMPTEEWEKILQNEIRERAEKYKNQDVVQEQVADAKILWDMLKIGPKYEQKVTTNKEEISSNQRNDQVQIDDAETDTGRI